MPTVPSLTQKEIDQLLSSFSPKNRKKVKEKENPEILVGIQEILPCRQTKGIKNKIVHIKNRQDINTIYVCRSCKQEMEKITVYYGRGKKTYSVYCDNCQASFPISTVKDEIS